MTLVATPSLVRAKLAEVLRLDGDLRVVALHAAASWSYDEVLDLPAGRRAVVRPCVSTLAVRDALGTMPHLADTDVLVVLTPLDSTTLGDSIIARFAAQRVIPIDRWQQLQTLFAARGIDPQLAELPWAVDALLASAPGDGFPPVPGGNLDRDTALRTLAAAVAGLSPLDLDLAGLLRWSLEPAHIARWQAVAPEVREGLTHWLAQRGSAPVVSAVLRCLAHPQYSEATVALGVVFGALTADDADGPAGTFATVLQTRLFGGVLGSAGIRGWGQAADSLVQRLWAENPAQAAAVCSQAERLLVTEAGAPATLAGPSPVLPAGLDRRLTMLAERLAELMARRTTKAEQLRPVEAALQQVLGHAVAPQHEERVRRAEMAVRLARWLVRQRTGESSPAAGLGDAARRQEADDAFVDWARARVWEGEVSAPIAATYAALCRAVDALRAKHEHRFAELLRDWSTTADPAPDLLPVELVLDEVVLPLTRVRRVLLVILDGMSTAVASELLADLAPSGWIEHRLEPRRAVMSVLPSVTRVSRTSLLCGRLTDGTAAMENAGFADRGWPLFHKADLAAAGAGAVFTDSVTAAVAGPAPVVGAVVNTVDDTLAQGGRAAWTVTSVDRLGQLLQLAEQAGRVVVLTADHGHVHERGSRLDSDDTGGARWRVPGRPPGNDEVELAGPRVLLGGGRIVAAWNEDLRYRAKANGYHGGASAQEVVIPLALLARKPEEIAGWAPRYHPEPDWWVETAPAVATPPSTRRRAAATVPPPATADTLFDADELRGDAWIAAVLDSPVVARQLTRVRRMGVHRSDVEALLRLLADRGGTAPRTVVARQLDTPDFRMNGLLATMQRVLNIDGYDVLSSVGETVHLNAALLKTQAGVG